MSLILHKLQLPLCLVSTSTMWRWQLQIQIVQICIPSGHLVSFLFTGKLKVKHSGMHWSQGQIIAPSISAVLASSKWEIVSQNWKYLRISLSSSESSQARLLGVHFLVVSTFKWHWFLFASKRLFYFYFLALKKYIVDFHIDSGFTWSHIGTDPENSLASVIEINKWNRKVLL